MSFLSFLFYDLSNIHLTSTQLANDNSVGRALHWYRRGHGFESQNNFVHFEKCSFTTLESNIAKENW